jgi:hypothetical protein
MSEPATYLLFAFADYYPSGGINDCRAVLLADGDEAAVKRANEIIEGGMLRDKHNAQLVRVNADGTAIVIADATGWEDGGPVPGLTYIGRGPDSTGTVRTFTLTMPRIEGPE